MTLYILYSLPKKEHGITKKLLVLIVVHANGVLNSLKYIKKAQKK